MDSVRTRMQRHMALMIAALAMTIVIGALGGEAWASAACIAGGGAQVGTTCRITTAVTTVNPALCPYVLALPAGEDLLITSTGSIKCDGPGAASGANITITVPGGQMEMQAGSEITSENTSGAGNGGNIAITVSGDFIMRGPGVAGLATDLTCAQVEGACISSSNNSGSGTAGNITITVGNFPSSPPVGSFTMEPGSAVLANATTGSGGAIEVKAGLVMDVDGLVRSFGGMTGTGGVQRPGGGPITLKSGCQLVITPDGVVSSEGRNPGADLVHLEGCEVTINGLVQSIAVGNGGHALPNNPANHCNLDTVTHPAVNKFTACVEVWANNITISSILPNKGQVSADGVSDATTNDTRAWIDLLAKHNITIINDNVGPYSVHANAGNTEGDFGGLITIKAELGTFVSTGAAANSVSFAVQANATGQSGNGGDVIIEAGQNVELNGALVQAQGGASGTNRTGGSISVRSFNGFVLGNAPGVLSANAAAPLVPAAIGVITLQGCGNPAVAGDGVNYTGTTLPAPTLPADQCGGSPTVPAAFTAALAALDAVCAQAPDCVVSPLCNKSGRKFNDIAGQPGLAGWQICLFDSGGTLGPCQVTGLNGNYAFTNLACGEEFTFCEVLQAGWTQIFPTLPSADPRIVSCQGLVGPGPLGPVGYKETLVQGAPSEHNDFGNHEQPPPPPKVKGKTQGFWHNVNGHAILDSENSGLLDTPVDIGGATRGFHVTTIAQSDKILPPNSACVAGSPVIFPTPCTLSDALNLGTLEVLAGQTLALTYNIGKIPGYTGQTMSTLGCTAKITAPLAALGLSASSTVNQVLTVANTLINNSTAVGSTTQAQAGAMNSLLGDCVNKE